MVPEKKNVGIQNTVYDIVHSDIAWSYWEQKEKLPTGTLDLIHWEAIQQALKEVPCTRKHFIIKHTMGMCGVGKFMRLWGKQDTYTCLQCGKAKDATHVWICNEMGALELWNKSLLALGEWMETIQMDPTIKDAILWNLSQWRAG